VQVLCLAELVYFTRQVEEVLKGDHASAPGSLRALRERLMGQLTAYTAHDLSSEPLLQASADVWGLGRGGALVTLYMLLGLHVYGTPVAWYGCRGSR
jgi:hypothetical protein